MNKPCPITITCDCDSDPLLGFSSETPDVPDFFDVGYARVVAPLGSYFDRTDCVAVCDSPTSQQAADLCAYLEALECAAAGIEPTPAIYLNGPAEASVFCPDGLPFTYSVPAGLFGGFSQLEADEAAESYALKLAGLHRLCLSDLVPNVTNALQPYSGAITATSAFLATFPAGDTWRLTGGALPPGIKILEFGSGTSAVVSGGVIHLAGTPVKDGTYVFSISITLANGDTMNKTYTITVLGVFLADDPVGNLLTDESGNFLMADL